MKWDEAMLNAYKSIAKERIAAKDDCIHDRCGECAKTVVNVFTWCPARAENAAPVAD